jgi:hypothetical protein
MNKATNNYKTERQNMLSLIERCPLCEEAVDECSCYDDFEFSAFIESIPDWLGTDAIIVKYLNEAYELGREERREE